MKIEDIKINDYILTPGRFVGAENEQDEDTSFEERFKSLKIKLNDQFSTNNKLQEKIFKSFKELSDD